MNLQSRNATACVVGQIKESTAQVRGQRFCRCDRALKFFSTTAEYREHGLGGARDFGGGRLVWVLQATTAGIAPSIAASQTAESHRPNDASVAGAVTCNRS